MLPFRRSAVALAAHAQRRAFVSPTTLSRSWEQHSVADLKKEARARGLSISGNKTRLVSRLQDHEKSLSSSAVVRASASSHVEPDVPGIPQAQEFHAGVPDSFLAIRLPDLTIPEAEALVQIPFVPDAWGSSTPSATEAADIPPPKILLVASAETHHGGGPTSPAINSDEISLEEATPSPVESGKGGFWDDAAESLGLPYPKQLTSAFSDAYASFKKNLK